MRYLETDSGSNVDIHAATAIGTYTADADRLIIVDAMIDAVAGNGYYEMYVTKQVGGAGSAYVILPKTTMTAASGETAISGQSGLIAVRSGDVLTVYVKGLAGDTTTPDYTTRWFEMAALRPATADRNIDVDASGKVLLQASQTGVTIPTVTDVTNAVKIQTGTGGGQLDISSGVVKANLAQILGSAITGTASQIVAAFTKFFNIATPTGTVNSLPGAIPGAAGGLPTTNGTKINQTVDLTAGQTIPTVTNLTNLPAIPADWLTAAGVKADAVTKIQSGLALDATVAKDATVSKPGIAQTISSNADITAIKAKTDNFPANTTTVLSAIQTDLDNPDQYKANVSGLASASSLASVDTNVGAIKAKTDQFAFTVANQVDANLPSGITSASTIWEYENRTITSASTIMSTIIEGTYTVEDIFKITAAVLAGKASGGGTTSITFRDLSDTLNRVISTVDSSGNRSNVTLDLD